MKTKIKIKAKKKRQKNCQSLFFNKFGGLKPAA